MMAMTVRELFNCDHKTQGEHWLTEEYLKVGGARGITKTGNGQAQGSSDRDEAFSPVLASASRKLYLM